jgi:hypothetical protein
VPKQNVHIAAFNRGIVSPRAMGRVDVERLRLCAEEQSNILPDTVGNGIFRPGTMFLGNTAGNAVAKMIPFIKSSDDTATLEFTNGALRIWDEDDALVTRPAVSTTVTDGNMSSSAGWTDASTGGGEIIFAGGQLELRSQNRGGKALVRQTVAVAGGDVGDLHSLLIVVTRGPVTFRCGTAAGLDEYVRTTTLREGNHSLAFTPAGNFVIEFESTAPSSRFVDSCTVAGSGVLSLPSPYLLANLPDLRYAQSGDVVFLACTGERQMRVERRDNESWSLVYYYSEDGPFGLGPTRDVRMKSSTLEGNTTLTTDGNFFRAGHLGSLFRIFSTGQATDTNLAREDTYSEVIRVFGYTDPERTVGYTIAGTWVATITVQRSFDGPDHGFNDFGSSIVANGSGTVTFGDVEGTEMWVRFAIKPGNFTSGVVELFASYSGGGGFGIARVVGITDAQNATAVILKPMMATAYSSDWREGLWSDDAGFPAAVGFYEGRLWWVGTNRIWGSVPDAYDSFDEEEEDATAPINRTIATGTTDSIYYLLMLQRMIVGTAGAELSVRSTSFDEPLAVDSFNLKDASTYGAANVDAVKVDHDGIFIAGDGKSFMGLSFPQGANDYKAEPLDRLSPEIGGTGIVALAVARRPETRVFGVREDGKCVVLTFTPEEELRSFVLIETDGTIEDVVVRRGVGEDRVYFVVNRFSTQRFFEKLQAREYAEGEDARIGDCGELYSGAATTTPSIWAHLAGQEVSVWADGVDVGPLTVSGGGGLTLTTAAASVWAGLPYEGRYKSAQLAYASGDGTALLQTKQVNAIGLLLHKTHPQGVMFGRDFDNMDDLPSTIDNEDVDLTEIIERYKGRMVFFPGEWDTDARLCLKMSSPKPCTVLAAVISVQTEDRR